MAKARYLTGIVKGIAQKIYPIGHTKAIYDSNGKLLEDRLSEMYTKNEVDNKFSALETNIDWKETVATYDDIATTYPSPQDGWSVNVKDTDYTYRYSGDEWVAISANAIPKATNSIDGLLSKEDHTKYEDANNKKHIHDNKSILDTITQTLFDNWDAAYAHISDTVKHITSTERALWNTVSNKVDKVSGKGLSTNDFTSALKSNYDNAYTHSQSAHAPSNAQANIIETVKVNGTALTPSSKAVNVSIPTKISQLTNDSGYKTTDSNTTYTLTKSGSTIKLTGSDGSETSVVDSDTNTTYGAATTSTAGLISAADKTKLDGVEKGANKTVCDTALSPTSTNPVQNKIIAEALDAKLTLDDFGKDYHGYTNFEELTQSLSEKTRTATIVVAAHNSTSKNICACDYICTGTDDQNIINSAINNLPSTGGKIVLLEGTYNIGSQISVNKSWVQLEGMGYHATTLNYTRNAGNSAAINITGSSCRVTDLTVENNSGNDSVHGIYMSGMHTNLYNIRVSDCHWGINATQSTMGNLFRFDNIRAENCQIGIHINAHCGTVTNSYAVNCSIGVNVEGSWNHISGITGIDNTIGLQISGAANYVTDFLSYRYDRYALTDSEYTLILTTGSEYNVVRDFCGRGKGTVNNGQNNFIDSITL